MTEERKLAILIQQAKERYAERGCKLPNPPWEIEEEPATWSRAVQCVQIELRHSGGVAGRYYGELEGFTRALLSLPISTERPL